MQKEETDLMLISPTPGKDAASKGCGENIAGSDQDQTENNVFDAGHAIEQVLPFCGVQIWPKDVDASCAIQEVSRLFEKKEQQHFRISENIREKVYARELVLSRLQDLLNFRTYKLNVSVDKKKDILTHLYQAQDKLSLANKAQRGKTNMSFSTEIKLDNHKLNFRMLHKSKNLVKEKQLLREINVTQQKDSPSTLHLAELSNIIQPKYNHCHYKPKICDRLLEEIKQFELTRKNTGSLRESIKNQVEIICDELMKMRKKKNELVTKIKHAEKELLAINEEIWSYQTHLKEQHCKKETSLFILKEAKGEKEDHWVLKCGKLEYESLHNHIIYSEKSSLSTDLGVIGKDMRDLYNVHEEVET